MTGKKIELLVLHCTATPDGREVYPDEIRRWHTDPLEKDGRFHWDGKVLNAITDLPEVLRAQNRRGRGWKQVGYSDMIMINQGLLMNLVRYNDDAIVDSWEVTNGATGINSIARHIVYVGGTDRDLQPKDTRTREQLATMTYYVKNFLSKYPHTRVAGHNQFAPKACPSFDVPTYLRSIGVKEQNIYKP